MFFFGGTFVLEIRKLGSNSSNKFRIGINYNSNGHI